MRSLTLCFGILIAFSISFPANSTSVRSTAKLPEALISGAGQIPPPKGYQRPAFAANSFATWLRKLPLKKSHTVFLYNGQKKNNQSAQFAVIDLSIGNKNLQQCADVCMRLRADYLRAAGKENEIVFFDNSPKAYRYPWYKKRISFNDYLEKVFSWCGTISLEKQMRKIKRKEDIMPGDVIINGGSPGHAVMIIDIACNPKGKKIFMLAQGYMPAQDIHILKNENDKNLSPWYSFSNENYLETPEWKFSPLLIKTWE